MRRHYGQKKDANHNEILAVFEKCCVPFIDLSTLGAGMPDVIVCVGKTLHLAEIKNPKTGYGRRGLNPLQIAWADSWRGGPVYILRSVDDALLMVRGKLDKLDRHIKNEAISAITGNT